MAEKGKKNNISDDPDELCKQADDLWIDGHAEKALPLYMKALQLETNPQKKGDILHGINLIKSTLQFKKDAYLVWENEGIAAAERGDIEQAIGFFNTSLEHKPDNFFALINLGNIYFDIKKEYTKAKVCFIKTLKIDDTHFDVWGKLSEIYIEEKDYKMVIKCLIQALAINPDNQGVQNNLFFSHQKLGIKFDKHKLSEQVSVIRLSRGQKGVKYD